MVQTKCRGIGVREPVSPVSPGPADAADTPAASGSGGIFSPPHLAATLTFTVVMFLAGFAALAVVPTLPTAARDLDGVSLFPVVAGCFVAAGLFGGVLGGHWADRSGARRPLALGMVLSVLTLLVSASPAGRRARRARPGRLTAGGGWRVAEGAARRGGRETVRLARPRAVRPGGERAPAAVTMA